MLANQTAKASLSRVVRRAASFLALPQSSLRTRYTIYGAILSSALVAAMTVLSYVSSRSVVSASIQHELLEVTADVVTPIRRSLDLAAREGLALSRQAIISNGLLDSHGRDVYLRPFLAGHHMPFETALDYNLVLTDHLGVPLASTGKMASYQGKQWVKPLIAQAKPYAGIDPQEGDPRIVLAYPVIYSATGTAEGVLVMDIPIGRWIDSEHRAFKPISGLLAVSMLYQGRQIARHEFAQSSRVSAKTLPLQGTEFDLGPGLELHVELDELAYLQPLRSLLWRHILFGFLGIALVVVAVRILASLQTRRIEQLATEASQIADGGDAGLLSRQRYGSDEVGELASLLGALFGRLKLQQLDLERQVASRTLELQARELDLNRAQAVAKIGSWVMELSSSRIRCSPETLRIYGLAADEPVNYDVFLGLVHPDDRDRADAAWRSLRSGSGVDFSHRIKMGAQVRWVRQRAELRLDADGVPVDAIGTVEDINERHDVEHRLRQLSTAVEQSPASILMTDLEGKITYVNPMFERSTGYRAEEVLGKNPRILKSKRKLPFEYASLWATIQSGQVWHGEFENVRKDGSRFFELASISPITAPDGSISGYVGVKEDITARKAVERDVAEREARLAALVDSLPDLMFLIGNDRRFIEVHAPDLSMLVQRPTKYIGKPLSAMWPPEVVMALEAALEEVDATDAKVEIDFRLAMKSGLRQFIASINPLRNPEGESDGFIMIARDETERLAIEAALVESESYNKALFARSRIPLIIMSPETGLFIDCNAAAVKIYGFGSRDDVLGRTPADVSSALQYDGTPSALASRPHIERALAEGSDVFDWRHQRSNGEFWDAEVYLMSIQHGGRILLQFSLEDITERRRTEERMREAVVVFNASGQGIMTTDAKGTINTVNPAFCHITGYAQDEVIGHQSSMFKSDRHDMAFYTDMWKSLKDHGQWEGEIWNRRKNGETYPQWLTISAVKGAGGQVLEYISLFSDITQRKQQEEAIWRQANFDALTGLANRSLFHDRLERALTQARRNGRKVGVLFLDLDGFKWINDTLGHDVGDELLVEVAKRLRACVREQDTVARLGGDEFTMVLHDLDAVDDLQVIGEKAVEMLREPFTLAGAQHHLSGSVGLTLFPDDGEDVQTLLKNADIAMYQSKQSGKNRFRFYAPHMQVEAQLRMQIEAELRAAIQRQEFVVHYQPVVDSDSGELVGAEALIRWQHPVRGLVLPAEFIPVAEDSGLIVVIGEWVLHEAARQLKAWQLAGYGSFRMAINVSGVQFQEAGFPALLARVLKSHDIDASGLLLEITESILMDDREATQMRMREVKAMGISYALDDFGTGYSSLSYLKRFPIDVVKIDRSFVNDSLEDRSSAHLIEAIVNMAHSLELKVTAEGVETETQCLLLRDLGCDFLQGYLISHPVPAQEFGALLERETLLPKDHRERAEERRLLAALRGDELDVDSWLKRLLGERSAELAQFALARDWRSNGLDLKAAVSAHLDWRKRLTRYVAARSDAEYMDSDMAGSVSLCELGDWIAEQSTEGVNCLERLDRHHREFHRLAGIIVSDYNNGLHGGARRALAGLRFREASRNVVVSLIDCFEEANDRQK